MFLKVKIHMGRIIGWLVVKAVGLPNIPALPEAPWEVLWGGGAVCFFNCRKYIYHRVCHLNHF